MEFGQFQRPALGTLAVDHVAHWVPDRAAAFDELVRLGFAPTPFSEQFTRADPQAPPVSAGTGNHCAMLERGYLEFLAPSPIRRTPRRCAPASRVIPACI